MKITRNDHCVYKELGELQAGEVFIEEIDDAEYVQMKLNPFECEDELLNAVSLVTGEIYGVDPNTRVRVVNAELIINNRVDA